MINKLWVSLILFFSGAFTPMSFCRPEQKDENLKILSISESPPLSFKQNGRTIGLVIDIIKAIQDQLKTQHPVLEVPWPRGYRKAQDTPNIVLAHVARTPSRESLFSMIGPIAPLNLAFYGKKDFHHKVTSLEDAKKLTSIGVRRDTIFETILLENNFANLKATQSVPQNILMLKGNRFELFLDSDIEVQAALKKEKIAPEEIKKIFVVKNLNLYIGFSPGTNPLVIKDWHRALVKIKKNGTFEKIYRNWVPNGNLPTEIRKTILVEMRQKL